MAKSKREFPATPEPLDSAQKKQGGVDGGGNGFGGAPGTGVGKIKSPVKGSGKP